jgi:hypothetical protein
VREKKKTQRGNENRQRNVREKKKHKEEIKIGKGM